MIRLIHEHNTLNGLRFSVIEFTAMAVAVVGFAIYVVNAGADVLAIALLGIGANCLVVAALGIRSLRRADRIEASPRPSAHLHGRGFSRNTRMRNALPGSSAH